MTGDPAETGFSRSKEIGLMYGRILIVVILIILSSCSTGYVWTHKNLSPLSEERRCQHRETYFYGLLNDFYIMSEFTGLPGALPLADLPFSFVADVVLLPISVPVTKRNKEYCDSKADYSH